MATLVSQNPIATRQLSVGAVFMTVLEALQRRRQYRVTLNELANLTTRDLDDLGIARGDIRRLARESAYGT